MIFSSIIPPVSPWEMGTSWPYGGKLRLLHQRAMASDTLLDHIHGRPRVCQAIQRSGVPQREGWDALTGSHPLSSSLPFTNFKSASKMLGTSALTASDYSRQLSPTSPPTLPHNATLHNI